MNLASQYLDRTEILMSNELFAEAICGKRVLVTGAGGSIGSEVAVRVASCFPEHLSLLTNTENHLYEISLRVSQHRRGLAFSSILCDIRDRRRTLEVIAREKPDIVFHCAALKHITLLETNPCEGVLTNVGGTKNVVDACLDVGVRRMVFLSTDKAVEPSSVMGMTKRVAELYCLGSGEPCRVARLVNVLGSSGSVLLIFQRQVDAGKPLTVTHPEMVRYFITPEESADYLLQAATIEVDVTGIFVPDIGPPTNILDLANRVAEGSHGGGVSGTYLGIRPGEKLDEALFYPNEEPTKISPTVLFAPVTAEKPKLGLLLGAARAGDEALTVEILKELIS